MPPRLIRPMALATGIGKRLREFQFNRASTLPLFEALSHSPAAFEDLASATHAALEATIIPLRPREVLILRTLARWNARAEWDVHVRLYSVSALLSADEIDWLGGARKYVRWSAQERLLIDVADALRDKATVPENLWTALHHHYGSRACAEILMIASQYVKVALLTRSLAIPSLVPSGPAISFSEAS